jgi:hypothetical protein
VTQHPYRFTAIVPAALVAGFNTWIRNNLDATGGDWLTVSVSMTGSMPYTHALFSAALTVAEIKKVMQRLCNLASIAPPVNWDSMSRAERKAWLISQRSAINLAIGVYIQVSDNDGSWDNPFAALVAKSLRGKEAP